MKLVEIKDKLENIEKVIFENSFQKNISLGKLGLIYFDLICIRNSFLKINFMELQRAELEDIKCKINESILNTKLLIKEEKGLNIDLDIKKMEEFLKLYQ